MSIDFTDSCFLSFNDRNPWEIGELKATHTQQTHSNLTIINKRIFNRHTDTTKKKEDEICYYRISLNFEPPFKDKVSIQTPAKIRTRKLIKLKMSKDKVLKEENIKKIFVFGHLVEVKQIFGKKTSLDLDVCVCWRR